MPCVLVGSGEYLPPMEEIDRQLLDLVPGDPHVVCLPTAAGRDGPDRIGYWSRLGVEHFRRLDADVESLPVFDRKRACDPGLAGAVMLANFVYLSGGRPDYLHRTLKGTPVWEAVLDVIDRNGVLAGCSAGAMVQGAMFIGLRGREKGFGLVPGIAVVPHYDELPRAVRYMIRAVTPGRLTMVGIDGDTALVQNRREFHILGNGRVTVWNGHGRSVYWAGDRIATDAILSASQERTRDE